MRRALLLAVLLLPGACSDAPVSLPKAGPLFTIEPCAPSGEFMCGEWEEEVFGNVFDLSDPTIRIVPRDAATAAGLAPYLNSFVWIDRRTGTNLYDRHGNEGAHYGWFGFGAHSQCADQVDRRGNTYERHWNSATSAPGALLYAWPPTLSTPDDAFEDHCLKLGAYVVQFEDGDPYRRPIDFISYSPSFTPPPGEFIAPAIENPAATIGGNDVVVHFDGTPDGLVATPVIEADVVLDRTAVWAGAPVSGGATISGSLNSYFRFGAWRSVPNWTGDSRGDVMVRYFWDYDGNRANRTGFVDATIEQKGNIRIKQYTAGGTYRVVAHLAQPDEFGSDDNADWGASRSFTVQVVAPLVASFTFSPQAPYVGNAVAFDASASSGTAPLSYKWNFGDGTPETAWLTNPVTTHAYTAAGTKTVVMTVRDAFSNTAGTSRTVTVTTPPPPAPLTLSMGGPTSVRPRTLCEWQAFPSGGTMPYSYLWELNGQALGNGELFQFRSGSAGASYSLRLTVTSADGQNRNVTRTVNVSASAPVCYL